MKNRITDIALRTRLTGVIILFILIVLMFRLKSYPNLVESYYALEIYPFIRQNLLFVFNHLPFSLGDTLYVLVIIVLLTAFILILRSALIQKKYRSAGYSFLGVFAGLEIAVIIFYLFWGLNYFRQPISERMGLLESAYSDAELIQIGTMLIDSANSNRASLKTADLLESNEKIYGSSVQAIQKFSALNKTFSTKDSKIKSSLLSPLMNYMGTAGYFNPFTGEAQINSMMPVYLRPFVACHEMAHQSGFGAEDEANFIGFLSGIASGNRLMKYSAYYLATQEFMAEIWRSDSLAFKNLKSRISAPVLADLKAENEYWTKYRGTASKL
ncbi:MAG: DUF3810 domain-containing protein, partial [Pedobacter sp.]